MLTNIHLFDQKYSNNITVTISQLQFFSYIYIYILLNTNLVITVNFDQFNASLLNSIRLISFKPYWP